MMPRWCVIGMDRLPFNTCGLLLLGLLTCSIQVYATNLKPTPKSARPPSPSTKIQEGVAEARLIEVYKLVGQAQNREALAKTDRLVEDFPHFQLAQLVHGDLLAALTRPLKTFGDVPESMAVSARPALAELREESQRRVRALRERPPPGPIPSQFLAVSQRSRHAIAVDASRSRLYLFENTAGGLNLLADYYISVGKAGTAKTAEGDQRRCQKCGGRSIAAMSGPGFSNPTTPYSPTQPPNSATSAGRFTITAA